MPKQMPKLVAVVPLLIALGVACTDGRGAEAPSGTRSAAPSSTAVASGRTFSGNGVSFSYPSGWRELTLAGSSASTGSRLWNETVGLDRRNIVSVSAFTLDTPITDADIAERGASIRSQIDSLFAQAGGSLESGPVALRLGGLPAVAFTGRANSPDGTPVESRLVLGFDGATEYFVNCQHDERGARRILSGCDRVVSTFRLDAG